MEIINKEKILEHAKQLVADGKFDRAIEEYKKLLTLDPEDLRIKIKIAELYVKRKQIQEAIALYTEVAKAYTAGGFYLKAATVYKNMLRLNPSLIDINIALSELYEKMGLIQDALYQYQIVATSLEQKNDQAAVLALREKMSTLDPDNISLKIRLAETYQMNGDMERSIDLYDSLSKSIKKTGKADQLIEIYNKILSHRPERHDLLKELCHMHLKRGELKEILKRMDVAKAFVDNDTELLAMQADIYARLNQIETSKSKYRELSVLLKEHGDIEGAIKVYDTILYLSPDEEEDIRAAVEELRAGAFEEVKKRASDKRVQSQEEESVSLKEEIKAEENVSPSQKNEATKAISGDGNANYNLGNMYRKMGLANEAKKEFEKALQCFKDIVSAGNGSDELDKKIIEIETFLGTAKPVKAPEPIKPSRPTRPAEPEKPATSSKKKISFV